MQPVDFPPPRGYSRGMIHAWRPLCILAILFSAVAVAGCAAAVKSADREKLWSAVLLAAQQQHYEIDSSDAERGCFFARKAVPGDNAETMIYWLEVRLRAAASVYQAETIVRTMPAPVDYALVDSPIGRGRLDRNQGRRAVSEFGTVGTRSAGEEKRIRDDIRANLNAARD